MLWQKYVDVIYMPETEAEIIGAMSKQDYFPDEIAYKDKLENQQIKDRLDTLFGRGEIEGYKIDQDLNKGDETVNENTTSDTSQESDFEK